MSKYIIYGVDHYDPALIGKRRRRINILFPVLAIISAPFFIFTHQFFNISIGETLFIVMVPTGGFFLFFYFRFRFEDKKIRKIGDIEFTKTSIIRHIGDSLIENRYDSIESIELHDHIPATTITQSKSGFYTHILSIRFKDTHEESLIVSDLPAGKFQYLSIVDTINTLKKITPPWVRII